MRKIDKELFLATLSCPTYGWILRSETCKKPLSIADQLRIDEGIEVHQRARGLFHMGVMVSGPTEAATQSTQQLLSDPTTTVIFEATFVYQDYIAKADILIRDNNNHTTWKIIEVKSNVNDDNELVDDLAYTTFVAQAAGLSLSACSLLLVNRNYRLGMVDEVLFNEVEHTSEVLARASEFKEQSDEIAQIAIRICAIMRNYSSFSR